MESPRRSASSMVLPWRLSSSHVDFHGDSTKTSVVLCMPLPWCSHGSAVVLSWCFEVSFQAPVEGLPWCFHGDLRASVPPWCFYGAATGCFHDASAVLPHGLLWCFPDASMETAVVFFHVVGVPMTRLWCLRDTIAIILCGSFLEARCFHGPWRVSVLCFHGTSMALSWWFHGTSMGLPQLIPWGFHGVSVEGSWCLRGASLVLPWCLRLPWGYRRAAMVLPWCGCRMVLCLTVLDILYIEAVGGWQIADAWGPSNPDVPPFL